MFAACSGSMSTGVPAASANSWAWHVRSIVMNHQAASSTDVCPTVSSPWFDKIRALFVPERVCQALAFLGIEHDPGVVVEHRMIPVEGARVLRQGIERPAQRRPGLAVDGVGVGGRHDVGAGGMDLRVDGEGGGVDRPVALDDLAAVVHQEEVLDPDGLEAHPEWVDPEVVGTLGIPCGDVAGQSLVEPELPEEPEGGGEALLAMLALVRHVVEPGEAGRESIRWHGALLSFSRPG